MRVERGNCTTGKRGLRTLRRRALASRTTHKGPGRAEKFRAAFRWPRSVERNASSSAPNSRRVVQEERFESLKEKNNDNLPRPSRYGRAGNVQRSRTSVSSRGRTVRASRSGCRSRGQRSEIRSARPDEANCENNNNNRDRRVTYGRKRPARKRGRTGSEDFRPFGPASPKNRNIREPLVGPANSCAQ